MWSLELSQSDHQALGHLSYQGPSTQITQFGQILEGSWLFPTSSI